MKPTTTFDPHLLSKLKSEQSPSGADQRFNRQLLLWLSDDKSRAALFDCINQLHGGRLDFPSRVPVPEGSRSACPGHASADGRAGHSRVTLVTVRKQIKEILADRNASYSSKVYAELGGGNFMLAMDAGCPAHSVQREAFSEGFLKGQPAGRLLELAFRACRAAAVLGLQSPRFNLAVYAEQAALRFVHLLMGYALKDFVLLESALPAAYRGLVYQVMERHFVTDPVSIPRARNEMALLLTRTAELIDAYALDDARALKGTRNPDVPDDHVPVLQWLGRSTSLLSGEQLATLAVGAAVGTVGNVQAAVCIAVEGLFSPPNGKDALSLWQQATKLASCPDRPLGRELFESWKTLLAAPLRRNPPIPFLPRRSTGDQAQELLLALGGATASADTNVDAADDPLVWGLPGRSAHWCLGRDLAWPLVVEVVRQVVGLPGLAQALDPATGLVQGLEKRNGFACTSFPLEYRRDRRRAQSSLNVAMPVRSPVRTHAEALRAIIRTGAPAIERLLRLSRHVHFAWFELIQGDSVLVLHTVYDGPFGAYLDHFARTAGDLFDALFEHIDDPPPMPVAQHATEFAAHLLRYDRSPLGGYFFSAYPDREAASISRAPGGWR